MLWLLFACTGTQDSGGLDLDGDGYVGVDCYEGRADIHPDADELCDGWDNDCDRRVDEAPVDGTAFYADQDGDGYGAGDAIWSCELVPGRVSNDLDCDDDKAEARPGAVEDCIDGMDNDCNGFADCQDEACSDQEVCQDAGITQLDLFLHDLVSDAPVAGAEANAGVDSGTSDNTGAVSLTLNPDVPFEVRIDASGYPQHTVSGHGGPLDQATHWTSSVPMYSPTMFNYLGQLINEEVENLVVVEITGPDGHLANVRVTSSEDYEVALVSDLGSSDSFSEGNTTLAGSASSVLFVNAAPGNTVYSVTPPSGYTCTEAPGEHLPINANTRKDSVNRVLVSCE